MNRRTFIKHTASTMLAVGTGSQIRGSQANNKRHERLAMTTVTFLNRFEQTRPNNSLSPRAMLTLMEIPEYFSDRFHLKHLEFWNRHFESTEDSYLKELKKRMAKTRTDLINIQLDGKYDLSARDESEREESIRFVKEWIDISGKIGSKGLRANPGGSDVKQSIKSFQELSTYAQEKGVFLYAENHMGFGKIPQNMVEIYQSVKNENFGLLTDFANFDASVDQQEGIKMLMPYTRLISAKAFYVNGSGKHPDYDFAACVQTSEKIGYAGVYSAEYYDPQKREANEEFVADWILGTLKEHIR